MQAGEYSEGRTSIFRKRAFLFAKRVNSGNIPGAGGVVVSGNLPTLHAAPVVPGGHSHLFLESSRKVTLVCQSYGRCNLNQGSVARGQQRLRFPDALVQHVLMNSLACALFKKFAEVIRTNQSYLRDFRHPKVTFKIGVNVVENPTQAARSETIAILSKSAVRGGISPRRVSSDGVSDRFTKNSASRTSFLQILGNRHHQMAECVIFHIRTRSQFDLPPSRHFFAYPFHGRIVKQQTVHHTSSLLPAGNQLLGRIHRYPAVEETCISLAAVLTPICDSRPLAKSHGQHVTAKDHVRGEFHNGWHGDLLKQESLPGTGGAGENRLRQEGWTNFSLDVHQNSAVCHRHIPKRRRVYLKLSPIKA